MKLNKLIENIEYKTNIIDFEIEIETLSIKAQEQMTNGMFFCFDGTKKGEDFIEKAKKNGAKVIVCDHFIKNTNCIVVDNVRLIMAEICQIFYDTKDIKVIGITGTNGKTTTSYIIKNILTKARKKVAVVGTNGVIILDKVYKTDMTTPDPIDLHYYFSLMKKQNIDYCIMEVSAHAIYFDKVYGINFVCKILTNITEDHLDFFENMKKYEQTKLGFFKKNDLIIANADDKSGQKLIAKFDTTVSYGLDNPSDVFCIELNNDCTSYTMNLVDNVFNIKSKLYGKFNVYNVMASASCCYYLGICVDDIKNGIMDTEKIDGRFNVIKFKHSKIIIDFAHTPDGLINVLKTARKMTDKKLYCLFGCGGNRDKQKRKIMGAIAEKYSDFCFVTSDNPRTENPQRIIDDILKGFSTKNYYSVVDRKTAICLAINSLNDGDTLIICGKGGENYIEIGKQKIEYSDENVVIEHIKEKK